MKIVCDISFFYLDKIDPKGTVAIECGKMLEKEGYKIKIFNTINFKKSFHYNPFSYIHSETQSVLPSQLQSRCRPRCMANPLKPLYLQGVFFSGNESNGEMKEKSKNNIRAR